MGTSECLMRIHQLDNEYREGLHRSSLINRDEVERRLTLKALALQDANAALEDMVSEKELEILSLQEVLETLKAELTGGEGRAYQQERELQEQRDEIQSLKANIENLTGSAEVLSVAKQEKAALTRELNSLRPELEQLKSQLASHQAVVASNGDLRRQLNTLEVELDNEKRSKSNTQQSEDKGIILDLRSKLKQYENKLSEEKRERISIQKELAKSRDEQEQQKERFDSVKGRLIETQANLKNAQKDLQNSRRKLAESSFAVNAEVLQKNPPKAKPARVVIESPPASAVETSIDETDVETPGSDHLLHAAQQRRRGKEHALLGEKSNFSITPFLNKSKDATEVYPELESDKSVSNMMSSPGLEHPQMAKSRNPKSSTATKTSRANAPRRQPSKPRTRAAAETEVEGSKLILGNSNVISKPAAKKRLRVGSTANAGHDDDNKENSDCDAPSRESEQIHDMPATDGDAAPKANVSEADGRKKRRKLLGRQGRTMFDDEETEATDAFGNHLPAHATRPRVQLGAANAFASSGKSFSPLKRERRGVNASFLA